MSGVRWKDAAMPQVPAATRALRVLRLLAAQPEPLPVERIAADLGRYFHRFT